MLTLLLLWLLAAHGDHTAAALLGFCITAEVLGWLALIAIAARVAA